MSKFRTKDLIDKFIYNIFNAISKVIFHFRPYLKRLIRKNKRYRNFHAGDSCFILGTGPSLSRLTDEQIESLNHKVTIAVNLFYKSEKFPELNPTYYGILDTASRDEEYKFMYSEIHNKYPRTTFLTDYRSKDILDSFNLENTPIYLYSKRYPIYDIECDISKNSHITMNVVSSSILTAIYMGFKEIYLLGCDYNSFASKQEVHFYDDKDELEWSVENRLGYLLKYYHLTTEFHYLIAILAKKMGVRIINLCESSLLDAYPVDTVDKVLYKS